MVATMFSGSSVADGACACHVIAPQGTSVQSSHSTLLRWNKA
jgi:hypothetical protein